MLTNRERLILLNLVSEAGSTRLRRLFEAFGSLDRVWAASPQELQRVEGIGPTLAERIRLMRLDERRLERERTLAQRRGVTIVTLEDADYPAALKTIPDPPLALYLKGALAEADALAVAIVGSRRASLYGLQCAERLAYDLALRGLTVVSGLALGIDGAAHQGALNASGRTLAVLGHGLNRLYPSEHERLAERIADTGALISEYPMDEAPRARNFPRRNRLISGLSRGVVVVEAAQRSGALITADCALEQGREVFAVPGPMTSATSQGTHSLVKQGARLVTSVEDILEELGLASEPSGRALDGSTAHFKTPSGRGARSDVRATPLAPSSLLLAPDSPLAPRTEGVETSSKVELPEFEQRVFACMSGREARYIDAIVDASGLPAPEVSSLLLQLELRRLVQQLPGKRFIRTSL